jgi:membrane associated rhomboid family serine protease
MTRFRPLIVLLAMIWGVEAANLVLGHGLAVWGILPRSVSGLIGIPLAPFIHANIMHAVSNTVPLVVLGGLTLTAGRGRFWEATILIIVLSGALVWVFARDAYHIGASGLVFGYFGILLARAVFERGLVSLAIAAITIALYGGLIWGVLPTRSYISFEAHLFGLIAGVAVAWLERKFRSAKGS